MLINAQHTGQVRIAIIDGTTLESYQVDVAESGLTRGNIYRGIVANIQPSLNAAFIDLGEDKHGFLSMDDALPEAYHKKPAEGKGKPRIDQVLERKRPILVQVTKDGIGNKGPALTTNLSLAGRYLVMMPLDDVRGISRKIEDDQLRKKVKGRLAKLNVPDGMGVIVRTNGLDQNQTMLNRDLNALTRLWRRIAAESRSGKGPRLLYDDQDLILQALRDFLDASIEQVIVDTDEAHERVAAFMATFMPRSKTKLIRYDERLPLFSRYHLENQIDRIYSRSAPLETGGSIVIDPTEALTAIDVNSGRATKKADHDESILTVNLEAAAEVGRQLRLRDIGGLVIVDFIDMRLRKHQRKVEKAMRDAMKPDRARHTVSRISANGLIEINRQRLKQALRHRIHRACPTCQGVGSIPSLEFAAVSLLRRIEARAAIGNLSGVVVGLHPELADALQNNHRREIVAIEEEFGLRVEVVAAANLHRTEERVEWKQNRNGGRETPSRALSAVDLASAADKKPRRRRGGKKADEPKIDDPQAAGAASAASADEEKESKPKRRRRRGGRRRKKATHQAEGAAQAAAEETSNGAQPEAEDDNESKPKRRRRGGRGRGRRDAQPVQSEDGDAESKASDEPQKDDAKAAPRRLRGGRTRGRKKATEPRKPDTSASADGAESPTEEKAAPAPRSRRGGRRRSPDRNEAAKDEKATEKATPKAAEEASDKAAEKAASKAGDSSSPSRSRRGGRSRGKTPMPRDGKGRFERRQPADTNGDNAKSEPVAVPPIEPPSHEPPPPPRADAVTADAMLGNPNRDARDPAADGAPAGGDAPWPWWRGRPSGDDES